MRVHEHLARRGTDRAGAHGAMGCVVSVNDLADRPPRPLQDGEVMDLGGKQVRRIETPHVPHGWDAGLLFEETTQVLLCGDLFTAIGKSAALTEQEITGPARWPPRTSSEPPV